ncbi:MAG: efflux RND transporter periplasmic adaptor subunit [Planctomycetota bacterium]|jgi:RND family efflux transporter MFP subunit
MKLLLKILLPVVILAVGIGAKNLLIATGPVLPPQEQEHLVPLVKVITAVPQATTLDLLAYGEVRPRATSSLVAEVAAKITEMSDQLYRGAFFKKGEVLLRLEDTDYRQATAMAEAQWQQALAAQELELAAAEVALEEWQRLGEGDAPAVVRREPQRLAAQASVDAAAANLEVARTNLARTVIVAPFDGRTLERNVEEGNWVAPGAPLAMIYATDVAEVRLPLPADSLSKLGLGLDGPTDPVHVTFEAVIGDEVGHWAGHLVRTEASVDPLTRMVEAIASIEDPFRRTEDSLALAPGMFLHATLQGRPVEGVFRIPRMAMVDDNHVRIADADDTAHEVEVTILHSNPTDVLISAGLSAGDRVILTPMTLFLEGMDITTEVQER